MGIDLCGNPSVPISIPALGPLIARAKAAGLAFVTHFAETKHSASDEELEGLLKMGPRRVGHVVHVGKEMRQRIADLGIGVEMCLSCNVLAGLTEGGWEGHHFLDWWSGAADRDVETPNVVLCVSSVFETHLCFPFPSNLYFHLKNYTTGSKHKVLVDLSNSTDTRATLPKLTLPHFRQMTSASSSRLSQTNTSTQPGTSISPKAIYWICANGPAA